MSEEEIKELMEVNIRHGMTKQQREEDKKLRSEAKKFQEQNQGKEAHHGPENDENNSSVGELRRGSNRIDNTKSTPKTIEWEAWVKNFAPHIVGITEVKAKWNTSFRSLSITTYDYHHLNLGNNKRRGLIMFTDKRLRAHEFSFGEEFDEKIVCRDHSE